jgi:hypothetical protein
MGVPKHTELAPDLRLVTRSRIASGNVRDLILPQASFVHNLIRLLISGGAYDETHIGSCSCRHFNFFMQF